MNVGTQDLGEMASGCSADADLGMTGIEKDG